MLYRSKCRSYRTGTQVSDNAFAAGWKRRYSLAALLLPLWLFMQSPVQADQTRMRLCYEDQHYWPYLAGTTDIPSIQPGFVLELIQQAAQATNIQLVLHRRPWKRCIQELTHNEVEGIFVSIYTPEREAWGRFPMRETDQGLQPNPQERIWTGTYAIFVHPDSQLQWNGETFSGTRFGLSAPLGYVAHKKLADLGVLADSTYDVARGLKAVAYDRLDGYVVESRIGEQTLAQLNLTHKVKTLPVAFMETDWYLPLSHAFVQRQPETARRFWQILGKVRDASGAALLASYTLEPPETHR